MSNQHTDKRTITAMLRAVSKFGGSSVADRACIVRVAALVSFQGQPLSGRNHLVVSAPGKRESSDVKVTDMLLQAHSAAQARNRDTYDGVMEKIGARFSGLTQGNAALDKALDSLAGDIYDFASSASATGAFAASRGEYLNGMVMAHETGFEFVDPADEFIIFTEGSHELDLKKSLAAIRRRCAGSGGFVIPGFFGGVGGIASPSTTATFSRGGSDVTASLVAAALAEDFCADEHGSNRARLLGRAHLLDECSGAHHVVHENFTDVDGVLSADPRICPGATRIPKLSYAQTHALAQAGAAVLHPDAVTPLVARKVPIHVRSTWEPHGQGTWISEHPEALAPQAGAHEDDEALSRGVALSVAGRSSSSSEGATVSVICRDVADEARGLRARRALQARVEEAIDARGITRFGAAESPSSLSVSVDIADARELNAAVAAAFGSIAEDP